MWLFALLGSAFADDLVLTDLRLDASNGVTLDYALSPSTWEACNDAYRRSGVAPTLVVQFAASGYDRTQHVELKEQVRQVSVASGTWPSGLTATVSLKSDWGGFDRIKAPSGSGSSVRVKITGGTPGAHPLGGLSGSSSTNTSNTRSSGGGGFTTAPAPRPQPVVEQPGSPGPQGLSPEDIARIAAEQERLRREAEEAARRAAELEALRQAEAEARRKEKARVEGIGNDANHPLSRACSAGFEGKQYWDCIWGAVYRNDGAGEVSQCARMERLGLRVECLESLNKRQYVATGAIRACVDVFGTEVQSMRCLNAVFESLADPEADIVACGKGYADIPSQMGCIKRFQFIDWNAVPVIEACTEAFTDEPLECVHMAARTDGPRPNLVHACGAHFDDKNGLECIYELKKSTGDLAGTVAACVSLFPDEVKTQRQCLERARRDPDPARIKACGSEEKLGKKLRCVGG